MIEKVKITDNTNAPLSYLADVDNLNNGTEFDFKPGVNIIIGPNGCGKTTLLRLIRKYLLIDRDKQSERYVDLLFDAYASDEPTLKDGVDVYSDYNLSTFNFTHIDELRDCGSDRWMDSFGTFASTIQSFNSSTGENVRMSLENLFKRMFSKDAVLNFPIAKLKDMAKNGNTVWKKYAEKYIKYIKEHNVPSDKENYEITVLLDEPDRNLDILSIDSVYNILSHRKEHVQIIASVHNPILIYKLLKCKDINVIEIEKGYGKKMKDAIDSLRD